MKFKVPTTEAFRDVLVGVLQVQQFDENNSLDVRDLESIWQGLGLRRDDLMIGLGALWSQGSVELQEQTDGGFFVRLSGSLPEPIDRDRVVSLGDSAHDLASKVVRPFRIHREAPGDQKIGRRASERSNGSYRVGAFAAQSG